MKYFFKRLFFLICLFSSFGLSAAHDNDSAERYSAKVYFDSNDLVISNNIIYVQLENNLIETSVIRSDQQGLYVFESEINDCRLGGEKEWKCPYCHHWWPMGQKCNNPNCPINQW